MSHDKDEYHISIFVSRNARVVHEAIQTTSEPQKIENKMTELARSYSWKYTLQNTYYLHEHTYTRDELLQNGYTDLAEHTRRSIVQLVDCPDLMNFYRKVENLLDISLPRPVPYITLFGWSDRPGYLGLGVNSHEEFEQFTVREI